MAADITPIRTAAETALIERVKQIAAQATGGALASRRTDALSIVENGLPSRRVEEWKYTDLRALMKEAAPLAARPSTNEAMAALSQAGAFAGIDSVRLAFVNGYFVADASDLAGLPAGLAVRSLSDALAAGDDLLVRMGDIEVAKGNAALALNSAFLADGALIRIAPGTQVAMPIHLRFVYAGAFASAPRVLIEVGEGASLTLLESHEGPDSNACQPNGVVELLAGDGANVTHVRLDRSGDQALALSTLAATLGRDVSLTSVNVAMSASVSRHQVFVAFKGEGSHLTLGGATMVKGSQHADTTLVVDHAVPHCDSRELYKTVIDGEATGVFQGKIVVRPHAQKTDGRMMSAALLLSEGGTMNNKPELEIFADDVQCAHGATCGQLDDDLLFYLMARGLPRAQAEALMVEAFLGEALELVEREDVREELVGLTSEWLRTR